MWARLALAVFWLADVAFRYVDDFVWEPIELPAQDDGGGDAISTPAEALAVSLSAIAQRQREHRGRTAERLRTLLTSSEAAVEAGVHPVADVHVITDGRGNRS
ncbi:hypothetical protein OG772_22910 [Streptomyces sp. NBC_01321]|uniref:hypothetical protein n=1 Tax=Streptomyces sp. NBC_01321 TaxID=2903825 RepID=UPI002E14C6DA|nr:hypothetical protein OG772_22910 [Streptomyces sp. NBC_01321]